MDNKKKAKAKAKANANRVAAYALSGVMLASMIPYNVFAQTNKAENIVAQKKLLMMAGQQKSPEEGIDQKVPFREKTYGVQVYPEGDGGPIRFNNVEVTKINGSEIYLKLVYWGQGFVAQMWGNDPKLDAKAPYHGRYVISFDNPTFYQNIASFETKTGAGPAGDKTWNSATSGRDWTMKMTNANLGAGISGKVQSFDLKITLKNGATLESLGLQDTPISFTSAMVAGTGAKNDFNKIIYNSIDNSFIKASNANNPNPDENPDLYAPNGAANASGDGRFASSNFTTNGIGQNVYFDEATNSIVSRHTIAYPPQNFGQANYSWVLYIKEQVPKVLLPYIDTSSIKLGVMNDVSNPGQFKTSVNAPIDPIPVSIDANGLVDTSKVPAISITQTDKLSRSEQVKALGVARKNLSDKVFEGTLGQPRTYSIVYKLKDGVSKVDMAKALAQAAQQSKSHLLFESWLVSDFVNTPNGPLNGATPYADNGAEPKRLVNSYSNAYFDSYYDLSMANLIKPTVKGIQVEVDGKVDLSKGIKGYVDDKGKAVTFDEGKEPKIEDITTEYKKNDPNYNDYDNTKIGNYVGRVRITYPDNSVEEVDVPVEVVAKKTDAEKNDPKGQNISAKVGDTVKAEDGIKNKDDLTNVKSYTFKEPVDTKTAGEKDAVVVVEYNDGTKDEVAIKVNVAEKTDAEKNPAVDPAKTEVKDKTALTDEEKAKVVEE
ncbi:MAG: Rib/alpha-like domain-containing protein, partial [Peptoniphilus harei]|nr:Rib/alpha-like domain-containing protein [Peptoniphilus harei]